MRARAALDRIPTLPGLPVLGHLLAFRREPLTVLQRLGALGGVALLRLGPRPVVVASSPSAARTILVERADAFEKGPVVRRFGRALFGEGIIACATDAHRERRRQVASGFQAGPRAWLPVVAAAIEAAVGELPEKTEVELGTMTQRIALAASARVLFSVDRLDATEIGAALDQVIRYLTRRIASPWLPPLGAPTPAARRAGAAMARLDAVVRTLIRRRREARGGPDDLLGALLAARGPDGPLSEDRLRDEVMNLLVAGHETGATALAWTLCLLDGHPAVRARITAEADAQGELPLGEQAIKESLRLFPPVHTLGRQARHEVSVDGFVLPPGTVVALSTYLLHRRSELHPDPTGFDPERFSAERQAQIAPFAYLPFGAGPRGCLGGELGLATVKLALAALLRCFRIDLRDRTAISPELLLTLRPRRPIVARLVRRR